MNCKCMPAGFPERDFEARIDRDASLRLTAIDWQIACLLLRGILEHRDSRCPEIRLPAQCLFKPGRRRSGLPEETKTYPQHKAKRQEASRSRFVSFRVPSRKCNALPGIN